MAEPEQVPDRRLIKKLAEVMGKVERIPKTGKNTHFNYRFAQEADVLDAIRGPLAEAHVMLLPSVVTHAVREVKTREGGTLYVTVLCVRLTFIDGETGETQAVDVIGEGQDSQDKGAAKAMTAAIKQGLLKSFLIPTGDDPDAAKPAAPAGGRPAQQQPAQDAGVTPDQTKQLRALVADVERETGRPCQITPPKTMQQAKVILDNLRGQLVDARRKKWPLPPEEVPLLCQHDAKDGVALTEQEWRSTVDSHGRPLCKAHVANP